MRKKRKHNRDKQLRIGNWLDMEPWERRFKQEGVQAYKVRRRGGNPAGMHDYWKGRGAENRRFIQYWHSPDSYSVYREDMWDRLPDETKQIIGFQNTPK